MRSKKAEDFWSDGTSSQPSEREKLREFFEDGTPAMSGVDCDRGTGMGLSQSASGSNRPDDRSTTLVLYAVDYPWQQDRLRVQREFEEQGYTVTWAL